MPPTSSSVAPAARPALASCATMLLLACEPQRPLEPTEGSTRHTAAAASSYYPPPESNGGWRVTTSDDRVEDLGIDPGRLDDMGKYLMSLPYQNYSTGVSGFKASNKAAIVVKDGWVVGEYYNQAGANKALYYTASNGKTFAMLLAGHMAQSYPAAGHHHHGQALRPALAPAGLSAHRQPEGRHHVRPRVPACLGHHPRGPAPDRIRRGADRVELELRAVHRREGRPVAPERARSPTRPVRRRPTARAARIPASPSTIFSLIFRNVTGKEAGAYLEQALFKPIGVGRTAYKVSGGMGDTKFAAAGNALAGRARLHAGRLPHAERGRVERPADLPRLVAPALHPVQLVSQHPQQPGLSLGQEVSGRPLSDHRLRV